VAPPCARAGDKDFGCRISDFGCVGYVCSGHARNPISDTVFDLSGRLELSRHPADFPVTSGALRSQFAGPTDSFLAITQWPPE